MIDPSTPSVDALDVDALAAAMTASLIGGRFWDEHAVSLRPGLADVGSEHLGYVLEHCLEMGYATGDGIDETHPDREALVMRWARERAAEIVGRLKAIETHDGRIRAHRLLSCDPQDVRNPLGAFWTWDLDDWCDPYSPWAENGRDGRTMAILGTIAVADVDWWTTALCNMDWYSGGENELRVIPGSPIRILGCFDLEDGTPLLLPDAAWTA